MIEAVFAKRRETNSRHLVGAREKAPAVIVGADLNGLGVAHSLGRAGVPCFLVEDRWRAAMHSRYVRPFVAKAVSGQEFIDSLLRLRSSLQATPQLFLTTDFHVRTVSEYRDPIEKAFHIRLPGRECVRLLMHKQSFQGFAEQHGFPVPRAIRVAGEPDLEKISDMRFPAVIKPGDKELFFHGKAPRAQKVCSREEAQTLCRAILPEAPDLIVQEWVEGEESDIYFCLQYRGEGGRIVSSFVGRKLRSWPPQTGSTASCTAAPEAAEYLERLTTEFFDETDVVGMCSMEFKKDRRIGKYFMIEPTIGRTDWQEEVASINGVDIPLAAYNYEHGLPLPERKTRSALVWIDPPAYFRSLVCDRSLRHGPAASIRMRSASWSLLDPVASVFFVLEWTKSLWNKNRWRKLFSERSMLQH